MAKQKRTKIGTTSSSESPVWQVLIEKIESENRLTIEAVNTRADATERKFEDRFEKVDARFHVLEMVVREHGQHLREHGNAIQELRKDVAGVDRRVQKVEAKVEAIDTRLQKVEAKVEVIDTRLQNIDAKVDKLAPLEERVIALERRPA